jgi:hypothetical protein
VVFSGALPRLGIWNPWTALVAYWLYFAYFCFTTLAEMARFPRVASAARMVKSGALGVERQAVRCRANGVDGSQI